MYEYARTVKELIELLQQLPEDMLVKVDSDGRIENWATVDDTQYFHQEEERLGGHGCLTATPVPGSEKVLVIS